MNKVLRTDRLILRPFTIDDIDAAYKMNLDEEVSRWTGDGGVVGKEEIRRRIQEDVLGDYAKYGYGRMAVVLKETEEFIGFCGLKYLEDYEEVDLGYRLMSQYWGRGYATEACQVCLDYGFGQLGLYKIIAMVLPQNKASIRVLDKLGFQFQRDIVEGEDMALLYAVFAK